MNVLLKKGYSGNIEELTVANEDFRNALYTGKHIQLVLMSLNPNEDIGFEVHAETDQFFRFEKGNGKVIIDDTEYMVGAGDAVIVPAGSNHNVVNTSDGESLKLYTLYSPSHHKEGTIFHTKTDAVEQGAEFDGVTTK